MLSPETRHRAFGSLFAEQIRAVGLGLIREGALAAGALALICVASLALGLRYGERLDLEPVLLQPTLLVAVLLPFAVWKGDPVFGRAFLWTLPVRRHHAAAAKMLAGAVWLMVAMLVTLVSLALVALATGGSVGVEEVRSLQAGSGGVARVAWTTPLWMWLTPFGGVLLLYFFSSAALLGLRYPIRWFAGIAVAVTLFLILAASLTPDNRVEHGVEAFREMLWSSRYGFDFVINGGEATLSRALHGAGREPRIVWSAMPEVGRWAAAMLVWFAAAMAALAIALRRHWER